MALASMVANTIIFVSFVIMARGPLAFAYLFETVWAPISITCRPFKSSLNIGANIKSFILNIAWRVLFSLVPEPYLMVFKAAAVILGAGAKGHSLFVAILC
jgi:hypothetical protein